MGSGLTFGGWCIAIGSGLGLFASTANDDAAGVFLFGVSWIILACQLALVAPYARRARHHRLIVGNLKSFFSDSKAPHEVIEIEIELTLSIREGWHALLSKATAHSQSIETLTHHSSTSKPNITILRFQGSAGEFSRPWLRGLSLYLADPLALVHHHIYFPINSKINPLTRGQRLQSKSSAMTLDGSDLEHHSRTKRRRSGAKSPNIKREPDGFRPYHPGDKPSQIAWKISARRGSLVVKDSDDVLQTSVCILFDVGTNMLNPLPTKKDIFKTIFILSQRFNAWSAEYVSTSLLTFADQSMGHVPFGKSLSHYNNLIEVMLDAASAFDENRAPLAMGDLKQKVRDHAQTHFGVAWKKTWYRPYQAERELLLWVSGHDAMHPGAKPNKAPLSKSRSEHLLRIYCQRHGIVLRKKNRWEGVFQRKRSHHIDGIVGALKNLQSNLPASCHIIIASHVDPTMRPQLEPHIKRLVRLGHQVEFLE